MQKLAVAAISAGSLINSLHICLDVEYIVAVYLLPAEPASISLSQQFQTVSISLMID